MNEATTPELRGSHIKANLYHGAGAYARCSYCQRYSDDPATLGDRPPACDCGEKHGWSGSFVPPTAESKWSGAALARRPAAAGVGVTDAQIMAATEAALVVVAAQVNEQGLEDISPDDVNETSMQFKREFIRALLALQPSPAEQLPVAQAEGVKQCKFGSLWVGDRFNAFGNLWTKIGHDTARQHSKASISHGAQGHGFIGDTVCSFEQTDDVEFVAPSAATPQADPVREARQEPVAVVYTFEGRKHIGPTSQDHAALMACTRLRDGDKLFTRPVEAERDAARYRWLKPQFRSHWATYKGDVVIASTPMVGVDIPLLFGKYGDPAPTFDIDAAIDAAMEQGVKS